MAVLCCFVLPDHEWAGSCLKPGFLSERCSVLFQNHKEPLGPAHITPRPDPKLFFGLRRRCYRQAKKGPRMKGTVIHSNERIGSSFGWSGGGQSGDNPERGKNAGFLLTHTVIYICIINRTYVQGWTIRAHISPLF